MRVTARVNSVAPVLKATGLYIPLAFQLLHSESHVPFNLKRWRTVLHLALHLTPRDDGTGTPEPSGRISRESLSL